MRKQSIKWHEDCLHNSELSLESDKKGMDEAINKYNQSLKRVQFYAYQIIQAKRLGKIDFDSDRFCVKKENKI